MCEISLISASMYSLFMLGESCVANRRHFLVRKEMGAISTARLAGLHAEI